MTRFSCFIFVFLLLAGCSSESATNAPTQAAARVNGEEISIHQLNDHLRSAAPRLAQMDEEKKRALGHEALDQLIDQALLAQQAHKIELERDPKVMRALEMAKRQVLAAAYLEKMGRAKAQVSGEQIKQFYFQHPELFSQRKLFTYRELQFQTPELGMDAVKQAIARADNIDQFEDWLVEHQVEFDARDVSLAAEQVPLERIKQLSQIAAGEVGFFRSGDQVLIVFMEKVIQQPMNLEMATPAIHSYLAVQSSQADRDVELERLRASAEIQYLGEFASLQSEQSVKP